LVRIPILAKDRRGRPISDLKIDEFVVKEGRRRLKVAFLDPFTPPPAEEREPLPSVKLSVDLPGGGDEVVTSLPEETRNIVFFIDVENDQKVGKAKAAADLVRFINLGLDDAFRIAVLSFNGKVNIEEGFTSNRRVASRAIERAFDRPPRPGITMELRIRQLIDRLEDCIIDSTQFTNTPDHGCLRAAAFEYADENRLRSRAFLDALEGVIQYVGGLEGHKSVVAVSHGVPADHGQVISEAIKAVFGYLDELAYIEIDLRTGEGVSDQLVETMNRALESRVTLHFIDRTLAPSGDFSAKLNHPYSFGSRPFHVAFVAPHQDLGQISATTGGTFLNMTDLYEGARQIMDLERGGYVLGFYTERYLSPDRLAKVSIKTTRKGVDILHRRGTYGRRIENHPQLGIRSQILFGRPVKSRGELGDKRLKVPFQLRIEPEDLGYRVEREFAEVTFTLHLTLRDAKGRGLADTYHLVSHSYPNSVWMTDEMEPVTVTGWAELPAGEFRLSARVRNPKLDLEGRTEQPLRIEAGSRERQTAPSAEPGSR
jgi:VWFA-related protein